ncbi:MAG TPA: metallophosphoesterase [Roseiarcus sp.]
MRLQAFSDLHVDFPGARGLPPLASGVSLVLVAGDTCQGLVRAVETLRAAYPRSEIAMVAGNHEYYGHVLSEELEAARKRAMELGVLLVENDTAYFGRLRVVGATMWTDYELFGERLREPAMRAAYDTMRDHKRIRWYRKPWQRFRPQEARLLHLESRAYLEVELSKPHDGPTLVMTHHAGTIEAIAPAFQRSLVSAAYASELLPIVDRHQPEFWLSGHTHVSMNVRRGGTRLISNPCGYADENRYFDPLYTIEIDA